MKKFINIIILFIFAIFLFAQKACAEEFFKFTAVNFDTSNSIIVLSAQDTTDISIPEEIKIVKMENPSRIYFDIDNSIITFPKQEWNFNTNGIKQIKISQFSLNPYSVRFVMYYDENNFNPDNIKALKLKNNINLKLKNEKFCDNEYFQNTYREEHSSSSDFYEYLTITTPAPQDAVVDQIQEAFNSKAEQQFAKKELKLNTKYYLNQLTPRQNGILISGFGALTIERPMILQNPTRIVYDLPNTLVNTELRNKEFKINETESVKIGQFSVNKARIVITTENVNDYIPIYSSDNQSIIIANYKKTDNLTLFDNVSNAIAYGSEKTDSQTESMFLKFDAPVVHGLDRLNNKLIIYLYNVSKYHEENFKNTFANTNFKNATIELMPKIGLKLTIPLTQDAIVYSHLGADGKTLKVTVQGSKPSVIISPKACNQEGKKRIVIDAGHGGTDTGAIGGNINEKDITLNVAKKVEKLLKQKGFDVIMIRNDDSYISLQDRVDMSEASCPDIFVSIHVNSSVKSEIEGVETHYYHQESIALAQTVHASLASAIDTTNRGLFKSKFYVINHTTSPAILVEIGFISNEKERSQLAGDKRKQATAKAIAEGIENYFNQLRGSDE